MKEKLCLLVALAILALLRSTGYAHEAPTGWNYPSSCCSGVDCRVINTPESAVKVITEKDGYRISTTGELIPFGDHKIKDSPDGYWHWCSAYGRDNTKTWCLFRPPLSY